MDDSMNYTMLEYFAGAGEVTKCFREDPKHRVASFELDDSPAMDFMSASGFGLSGLICFYDFVDP